MSECRMRGQSPIEDRLFEWIDKENGRPGES